MEYHFIAICACSAPGLKHHVAEEFYGHSEDSGDHFACISSGKKSEKKPARSKDFEGECDDAWQELRKKKIPDILCLQFFILFQFLPILLFPPRTSTWSGMQAKFPQCAHSFTFNHKCFFFLLWWWWWWGGGSLQSHASLPLKAQGCYFALMATGRRSFQMSRSNANLRFFFPSVRLDPQQGSDHLSAGGEAADAPPGSGSFCQESNY